MTLRFGMLGMWHTHADGLVRQIAEHPREFSLQACFDPEPQVVAQRRKQWGARLGNLRVLDKPEQVLDEPIDAVVVEGRVHDNLRYARLALEAGKPVLLEKPAGDNFDEFRRVVELAQKKHLHLQMIYLFRYMSAVQEVLQRVRKGEVGNIYHFSGRLPKDLPSYQRYVEELNRYPGGMFFEMAGHAIDLMIALLGKPRRTTPFLAHHHREGPANFIDNGLAVFTYPQAWGTVEIPTLEVAPHSRRFEIFGTEGALVIPHLGSGHLANRNVQTLLSYRKGQAEWQTHELPAQTLQIRDLREFALVAAGKKQPDFNLDHDLAVQETLLLASGMMPAQP